MNGWLGKDDVFSAVETIKIRWLSLGYSCQSSLVDEICTCRVT